MKTTKVTFEIPNISDHRQVRNGVAGIAAFGLSCAGAVHFFSQTRYKEALGAGVLSMLSLGIAVDALTNESKIPDTADLQNQGSDDDDLETLCEAVKTSTQCLSEGQELSSLASFKFKNPVIAQLWGNFQKALQIQRSQFSISSRTITTLTSPQPNTLSPTSKSMRLVAQYEQRKQAESQN